MKKVKVNIEEHLNREINIEIPDGIEDPEAYADEKVAQMYRDGEIVLTSDDYNGVTLMSVGDSEYYEI